MFQLQLKVNPTKFAILMYMKGYIEIYSFVGFYISILWIGAYSPGKLKYECEKTI